MADESPDVKKRTVSLHKIEAANLSLKSDLSNSVGKSTKRVEGNVVLKWSILTLMSNLWVLFSVTLWPSIVSYPAGIFFVFDCLAEIWLFIDIICRIALKRYFPMVYKHIELLHANQNDSYYILFFLLIVSVPQYLIYGGALDKENNLTSTVKRAYFSLFFKLLRSFEIRRFFRRAETLLYQASVNYILALKFFTNILTLVFVIHFAACSWMLVAFSINIRESIPGYYERTNTVDAPLIQKYVDAATWAVSAMTGNSYGDVTPKTNQEAILATLIMTLGATLFAKIFSDFEYIISLLNRERIETMNKFKVYKKLIKMKKIDNEVLGKVERYAEFLEKCVDDVHFQEYISSLPESLKSEITLSVNKDVIPKCNIFNTGDPVFLSEILLACVPYPVLKNDIIFYSGDQSEAVYFIKTGEFEVMAPNEISVVSLLSKGAYFGELGVLLNTKRTLTVRAKTDGILNKIDKDSFLAILAKYPEQELFFKKIAKQRLMTTTLEELGLKPKGKVKDIIAVIDGREDTEENKESNATLLSKKNSGNPGLRRLVSLRSQPKKVFGIKPYSTFFYVWSVLVFMSVIFEIFYVPIGLFFTYIPDSTIGAIDSICLVIYFLDIFVNSNMLNKENDYQIQDRSSMIETYIKNYLSSDILCCIPFDHILLSALDFPLGAGIVRILRLLKIARAYRLYNMIIESRNFKFKQGLLKMILLILIHIVLNHYVACCMYAISNWEYKRVEGRLDFFQIYDARTVTDVPLQAQSVFVKYITFLYWTYATSSGGSYGDLLGLTVIEKSFEIFGMVLFKVYLAFVSAQITNIIHESVSEKFDYFDKINVLQEWASHNNLPSKIGKQIKFYYENLWEKCHGLDEDKIVSEIPENIRTELIMSKYENLLENLPIFPRNNRPLLIEILMKFKNYYIPKDEYITRIGEISDEIFVILEGKAAVQNYANSNIIEAYTIIESIDYETMKPIRQNIAIKSETSMTFAILTIADLVEIKKKFPKFLEKYLHHLKKSDISQISLKKSKIQMGPDSDSPPNSSQSSSVKTLLQTYSLKAEMPDEEAKKCIIEYLQKVLSNFNTSGAGVTLIFLVYFLNYLLVPLNLAFPDTDSLSYRNLYPLEIITMLILSFSLGSRWLTHYKTYKESIKIFSAQALPKSTNLKKRKKAPKLFDGRLMMITILEVSCIIPFAMIFELNAPETRFKLGMIALQLIRLVRFDKLLSIFALTTKKMALMMVVRSLFMFFLLNHLFASFFIVMGRRKDPSLTWFGRLPAPIDSWPTIPPFVMPSDGSLYLAASYWAYVTTGHVGIGDICSVDNDERVYTVMIFFFGTFLTIGVFGNIVTLAEKLAPILKLQFQKNYRLAMDFAKNYQLTAYIDTLEKLFNYIWDRNKGLDENIVLEELSNDLRADINYVRFFEIINTASSSSTLDLAYVKIIFRSFFKWSKMEVYTTDDLVLDAGQVPNKLYLLVDGEAECTSFDKEKTCKLDPGKIIGCIHKNAMYYGTIRAKKECKFATITEEQYEYFVSCYPDWVKILEEEEESMKQYMLMDLSFFGLMKIRMDEDKEVEYKVDDELVMFYSNSSNARKILDLFAKYKESKFQKCIRKLIRNMREYKENNPEWTIEEIVDYFHPPKNKALYISRLNLKENTKVFKVTTEKSLAQYINQIARKKNDRLQSKYYILNNSKIKTISVAVHSILVLYSTIQLPIWISYLEKDDPFWLTVDTLVILESIIFIILNLRTAIYVQGTLTVELKHTFAHYLENGFILDVIGAIPFNLFFAFSDFVPYSVVVFRILRIFQALNLRREFDYLEGQFRQLHSFFKLFKTILVLIYVWHWTSCLWYFIDKERYAEDLYSERNWLRETGAYNADVIIQWIYSLEFTMSIATTTGYAEMRIYSDFERFIFILVVYIGSAMFALGFGLMSSATQMFSDFFEENYLNMRKLQRMAENKIISQKVLKKVQDFNAFRMDSNFRGNQEFEELREIIPPSLIEDLIFDRVKDLLLKLPILGKTDQFLREMASSLDIKAYLPMDYIFHKGDHAGEIVFIIEGAIGIVEEDGTTICKILGPEDNTGELYIFKAHKREYSAIALKSCICAIFHQYVYEELIQYYPIVKMAIEKEIHEHSHIQPSANSHRIAAQTPKDAKTENKSEGKETSVKTPSEKKGASESKTPKLTSQRSQRSLRKMPPNPRQGTFKGRKSIFIPNDDKAKEVRESLRINISKNQARRFSHFAKNQSPELKDSVKKSPTTDKSKTSTNRDESPLLIPTKHYGANGMVKSESVRKIQVKSSDDNMQNILMKSKSESYIEEESSINETGHSDENQLRKSFLNMEDFNKSPSPREAVLIDQNEPTDLPELSVNKIFNKKLTLQNFDEKVLKIKAADPSSSSSERSQDMNSPLKPPQNKDQLKVHPFDDKSELNSNYLLASNDDTNGFPNLSQVIKQKSFQDFDDHSNFQNQPTSGRYLNGLPSKDPEIVQENQNNQNETPVIDRGQSLQDATLNTRERLAIMTKSYSVEITRAPTLNFEQQNVVLENPIEEPSKVEEIDSSLESSKTNQQIKTAFEQVKNDLNAIPEEKKLLFKKELLRVEEPTTYRDILDELDPDELMKEHKVSENRAEVVEENELMSRKDKPSKRFKPRYPGERRFSRISMVKELGLTKDPCVHLRWGMNLD